jgi:cell wall-associated NlpC family hydrolase
LLTAAALVVAPVGASPPGQLQSKRAQAVAVLAQVQALDVRFGAVVEHWNGARIALADARRRVAANRVLLRGAVVQQRRAQQRVADRLVSLYEGNRPDLVAVVVGASKAGDLIDAVDTVNAIVSADHQIAVDARLQRDRLARVERSLAKAERERRTTVALLATERVTIGSMLSRRRRLLASVRSEVAVLEAQQRQRQARLAAEARARLAREQAVLRQQAAERARAAAAAAAAAKTPPPTSPTTPPAPDSTPAPTDTVSTAPSDTAPAPLPAPALPGTGHPDAASIAMRYLGIPYRWGGGSPGGFDCSGLVMYVYAQLGVSLPHYAAAQFNFGTPVARPDLQPGDLVFFDGLSHVGIYIGGGQMIHAPHTGTVVQISSLDEFGSGYVGARRL